MIAENSFPDGLAEFSLASKHVVVTGGGRGIGQAIAYSIAAAGGRVSLLARSADQLAETAATIREHGGVADCVVADLTALSEIDEYAAEAQRQGGPIDGVVHAAGTQLRKNAEDLTADDLRAVLSLNLEAPILLSAAIARQQLASGTSGSHVFIGSLNSSIGLARVAPYASSKTGIVGAMRSLSAEWSSRGIRTNVVSPGYFHTAMTDGLLANPSDHNRILSRIPMGRLGQPSEVGPVVVFALSDASRYVSGQVINVDGGWLGS